MPGEVPAVAAGLDEVADAGDGALQAQRNAGLLDAAEADEFGAELRGQAGGLLVGVDQQQRPAPGEGVGQPCRGGGGLGLLEGAGVEQPALAVVVAQHGLVAVAQPQRRFPLPRVGEAAGVGQLVAGAGLGEQVHPAAGADRGELAVVADEQQLGAGGVDVPVDGGQGGGVGHRGLVDHDQVPGAEPPRRVVVDRLGLAEPGPAASRSWVASQRSTLRAVRPSPVRTSVATWLVASPNTRPDLGTAQCGVGPGAGERADDERLAGAGRPDEGLDPRAGGEDAADGGGLVVAELDALGAQTVEEPLRDLRGQRRRVGRGVGVRVAGGEQERSLRTCSGVQYSCAPDDW